MSDFLYGKNSVSSPGCEFVRDMCHSCSSAAVGCRSTPGIREETVATERPENRGPVNTAENLIPPESHWYTSFKLPFMDLISLGSQNNFPFWERTCWSHDGEVINAEPLYVKEH